ncbi:MAG: DUF3540 domain-containing protein [Sandaracinaceae bacterium]|nr:DUF3540 domain-containing protein [Sandaracinaceae bacterium]
MTLDSPREPAAVRAHDHGRSLRRTGSATVSRANPLTVRDADGARSRARLAVTGYAPTTGDAVLTTRDDDGVVWIIGVIQDTPVGDTPLLDAALEPRADPRRVHDRSGRLLFEYDPVEHRAVLHVPDGDLVLRVPEGQLELEARDGVSIRSPEEVRVESGRGVRVEASHPAGAAHVEVTPGEVSVFGSLIRAAGRRAELAVTEAVLRAEELESRTRRSRIVAEVIDTRAGRIVERARDSYREVERLAQVRAGRLRFAAEKAAQMVGDTLLLKARKTAKVKGERIHLA